MQYIINVMAFVCVVGVIRGASVPASRSADHAPASAAAKSATVSVFKAPITVSAANVTQLQAEVRSYAQKYNEAFSALKDKNTLIQELTTAPVSGVVSVLFIHNKLPYTAWVTDEKLIIRTQGQKEIVLSPMDGDMTAGIFDSSKIVSVAWHPTNAVLAVGCHDGGVFIITIQAADATATMQTVSQTEDILFVEWAHDGALVVKNKATAHVYDTQVYNKSGYRPTTVNMPLSSGDLRVYNGAQNKGRKIDLYSQGGADEIRVCWSDLNDSNSVDFFALNSGKSMRSSALSSEGDYCALVVNGNSFPDAMYIANLAGVGADQRESLYIPVPCQDTLLYAWHPTKPYCAVLDCRSDLHIINADKGTMCTFINAVAHDPKKLLLQWVGDQLTVLMETSDNKICVGVVDELLLYSDKQLAALKDFFSVYEKSTFDSCLCNYWLKRLTDLPKGAYKDGAMTLVVKPRDAFEETVKKAGAQAAVDGTKGTAKEIRKPSMSWSFMRIMKWSAGVGLAVGVLWWLLKRNGATFSAQR